MSAETVPATTPDAASPEDVVSQGRARIDELDAQIVALVQERMAVSRGIQQARIAAGGRRVEHGRELQIVDRYAKVLGQPGSTLALTLLELCRGKRLG